ncbi:MAG: hypothetical protein JJE16_09915 [Nitrospiraceae bacterium]|nr:hypothetical protein [Nitrospiraceae bacterium]
MLKDAGFVELEGEIIQTDPVPLEGRRPIRALLIQLWVTMNEQVNLIVDAP